MTPKVIRFKNSTIKIKKTVDLRIFDDEIHLYDQLSANNVDKYNEYAKLQENVRVKFLPMDKDCEFLKTWLHTAYADIMELKPESSDLTKLYETLLKNNLIKEFLEYAEDLKELRLKFVETIIEREALKKNSNSGRNFIVTLKSRYNNLVRYEKKHGNKKLLRFAEYIESLRSKLMEKIDNCKTLKIRLNKTHQDMVALKLEHEVLMERYKVLSENKMIKEFIDYAKQCKTRPDGEIASLQSELTNTRNILNEKRSECEKITKENAELRRSLSEHQRSQSSSEDLYISASSYSFAESDSRSYSDFKSGSSISSVVELPTDIEESYEEFRDNFQRRSQFWYLNKTNKEPDIGKNIANGVPIITATSKSNNSTDQNKTSNVRCHICDRNFASNGNLNRHMKNIHCGTKPFQSTTIHLKTHSIIHGGSLKQLKCATCGKSVTSPRKLKLHQSVHSSLKPFQCSFCDRKFKYQTSRRTHEKATHVEKSPFPCTRCDKEYCYKHSLLQHVLKHHSG